MAAEFEPEDFYDAVESILEDDEITSAEEGFIAGYMGDLEG